MNIEIRKYAQFVLRRIWIVVIMSVLLGGITYLFFNSQPPVYRATATLFIGNALSNPNPDLGDVQIGELLTSTYAAFATLDKVLVQTIENLNLEETEGIDQEMLSTMVSTRAILDTAFLEIRVDSQRAQLSADIANDIANNIILISPSNLSEEEQTQLDLQNQQIDELRNQIVITSEQSVKVLEQLNQATERGDEEQIRDLQDDYNRLVDQLNSSRSILTELSKSVLELSYRVNLPQLVNPAIPPTDDSGFSPKIAGVLGAGAGAGLAIGSLLLVLEYLDSRLRTEREVRHLLSMRVLGTVAASRKIGRDYKNYLISRSHPTSYTAEDYRSIRTNMLVSGTNKARTFIITSGSEGEGRTLTAVNLALVLAETRQNVLLIDADLRNSSLHNVFSLKNEKGFINLLQATAVEHKTVTQLNTQDGISKIARINRSEKLPNLSVITAGSRSADTPSTITAFESLQDIIDGLREAYKFDVIIFDTSPCLLSADTYTLAAQVDGDVIMLVESGRTEQAGAIKMKEQFEYIGRNIAGVILNKV